MTRSSTAAIARMTGMIVAGAVMASSAWAGLFSVSPVRIYVTPRDRAVAVTITNEGDEELVMQAELFSWKQKPGGEDELTPTEDLILSPPIVKVPAKGRQVVRLALLQRELGNQQLTYRMIVREVPEARPAQPSNVQLQIALAFNMPVFVTPPNAKRQLDCRIERVSAETVRAACENSGTAYAQLREFVLSNPGGDRIAMRDTGGYILPAIKRTFDIKRTTGDIPAGPARLAVSLDDGTTQSYDVTVAP